MKQQKYEFLSALVDGELGQQTASVIDLIIEDETAKTAWSRYHLIGDSLRQNLPDHVTDIAASVKQRIVNEPLVMVQPRRQYSRLTKPLLAFAAAASITIAIILVNKDNNLPFSLSPDLSQMASYSAINPRLNKYILQHNEYRANTNFSGISPHARMVTNHARMVANNVVFNQ